MRLNQAMLVFLGRAFVLSLLAFAALFGLALQRRVGLASHRS